VIAEAKPSIGDLIGPYRVESLLAEGAMGRVYKAQAADREEVAVRLVRASLAKDGSLRRRFAREARLATRIDHRHVVPCLDAGEFEGMPYLVFKFLPGGSLRDRLKQEGRLRLDSAVKLCDEIASGLDALHEAGLVHRNLKPTNIVLDEDGSAHITDFALAKDRDASILTKPGQALGTMDYMAPEQIRGAEASGATDLYALGCIMCECLSGSPPFGDQEGMRILWSHLQDEPPDPCAARNDVPKDLGWAITRALDKDPGRRPPSATAYARMVHVAAGFRAVT
jgi:serine/threonine-protein kinase